MDVNTPKRVLASSPPVPLATTVRLFVPFPLRSSADPGVVLFGSSGGSSFVFGFEGPSPIRVRRVSVLEHSDGEGQINKVIPVAVNVNFYRIALILI